MSKGQQHILICHEESRVIQEATSAIERIAQKMPDTSVVVHGANSLKQAFQMLSQSPMQCVALPATWLQESNREFFTYIRAEHPLMHVLIMTEQTNQATEQAMKLFGLATGSTYEQVVSRTKLPAQVFAVLKEMSGTRSVEIEDVSTIPNIVRQGVFTFFSVKGGTGKTTYVTELAKALTEYETHAHEDISVCLLDFDVEGGNVCMYLNIPPHPNMLTWLEHAQEKREKKYRFEEYKGFLTKLPDTQLYVLPAPMYPHQFDAKNGDESFLRMMITNLKHHFDVILIDAGRVINHPTTSVALDMADTIYLLARPEETELYAVDSFLHTAKEYQFFSFEKMKLLWVTTDTSVDARWMEAFRIEEHLKTKWECGVIPFTNQKEQHKAYTTAIQSVLKRIVPQGIRKTSLLHKAKKWLRG